jgi:hypothetical protein
MIKQIKKMFPDNSGSIILKAIMVVSVAMILIKLFFTNQLLFQITALATVAIAILSIAIDTYFQAKKLQTKTVNLDK